MTIEEKRKALDEFCKTHNDYCDGCVLNDRTSCHFDASDIEIEDLYGIVFEGKNIVRSGQKVDCECSELTARAVKSDEINHPDRYNSGGFECIDVMLAVFGYEAVRNFCILNAFKYIWRHKQKGGAEDIKKAVWYLNKFVELEELPDD